jgi:hypothetical protein
MNQKALGQKRVDGTATIEDKKRWVELLNGQIKAETNETSKV